MRILSTRDAYGRWASTYTAETAVSALEDHIVGSLAIATAGRTLLDVGCGTGRRLQATDARSAVGVDYTPAMLSHAARGHTLAAADVRALPFADGSFDVIWCRLVIGHVREIGRAYAELARVCRPGGHVVVTDFHPDASAAGHRRTFRDDAGVLQEIEHFVHRQSDHENASAVAGLARVGRRDGEVGPGIRRFYDEAGRARAYDEQLGLRIVLALAYRRVA
jgi:ubiquinone/menaquinone biosynthesis C-methylase UbiE